MSRTAAQPWALNSAKTTMICSSVQPGSDTRLEQPQRRLLLSTPKTLMLQRVHSLYDLLIIGSQKIAHMKIG
eukprot:scaffold82066_cov20-Prasinocladus_malaysianus.AAC.1